MINLKVGIITHNFPSTASDRQNAGIFVYDFADDLSKLTKKVIVYCCGLENKSEKIGKVDTVRFKWFEGAKLGNLKLWKPNDVKKMLSFFISGIKRLEDFYKINKPDVLIAMWVFPGGLFAYILKKKFKIPYGVWALGSDIYVYSKLPIFNFVIKKILKNADFLMGDGIYLSTEVSRISGKKCYFIPSASKISTSGKKFTKKGNKKIVITFLGRLELAKGPDILVDAAKNLIDIEKYEFHIMGDGNLLQDLQTKVNASGLNKIFIFYGNVSNPKRITWILERSDWLIIPSRSDSIPLTFSESMKANVPVITSDLPDLKYLVNKYKVGITFKAGSSADLFNVLKELIRSNSLRDELSRNTSKAARLFEIKNSIKKILKIIRKS